MENEIEIDTWTVMGTARHLQQYGFISVTGSREYVELLIKKMFGQYSIESYIDTEKSSNKSWLLRQKE